MKNQKKSPRLALRAESISLEGDRGDRKNDAALRQRFPIYIGNGCHHVAEYGAQGSAIVLRLVHQRKCSTIAKYAK
ncbi:hypothetical protein [Massilia solisilvae]